MPTKILPIALCLLVAACTTPPAPGAPAPEAATPTAEAPEPRSERSPATAPADARDAAGYWTGAIELPGSTLEVAVNLRRTDEGWTGEVSIPAQGARDLPLGDIRIEDRSARFTIQGVPGDPTFDGTLSAAADTLAGEFHQAGGTFPFTLVRSDPPGEAAAAALADLDEWIERALRDFEVPGAAVGVVSNGEVVMARGFGMRDVAGGLPVDENTLFAIGSSTKAFTTFGLARLGDTGNFDWDRRITEYLPRVRFHDPIATQLVTPRDMVAHRTGLPRHDLTWYNDAGFTAELLIESLPHLEPNRQPREIWQYNNLMYVLAGHLLGELHGGSWESAVSDLILRPLGMTETNFGVRESQRSPNHALPYGERGDTVALIPFRDIRPVGPAGSINSSISDMVRWARVHVEQGRLDGEQHISEGALREMHTPQVALPNFPAEPGIGPMSYGLGWFVEPYRGHYRVHHGGNIDGFSALVTLFPFDGTAVVVLTNKNATGLPDLITRHVADRLLDLEPREWDREALQRRTAGAELQRDATAALAGQKVAGTSHDHPLVDYAGVYRHPGYGDVTFQLDGGRLVAEYNGITAPLEHWHYEVFSGLENPDDPTFHRMKFRFDNDLEGRVAAVEVPLEIMVSPIRFERRPDERLYDPGYLARFAGEYHLGPQRIRFDVRGDGLVLSIPGQPEFRLEPDLGAASFRMRELQGFRIVFDVDDADRVRAAVLHQPNGIFRAERAAED